LKKLGAAVFSVLLLMMLCGCRAERRESVYTTVKGDTVFTVDTRNGTITDHTDTYFFDLKQHGTGYRVEIAYPNNAIWWWESDGQGGHGGWSDDYDDTHYVSGDILCEILTEDRQSTGTGEGRNYLLISLLLIIGIFNAAAPRASWYLTHGWKYQDVEPSDLALSISRGIGILAAAAAVLMILL